MSQVEIDEMLRLVCDVTSEVTTNDRVPGGVVFLVEFLLDIGGDVLFDVELFQRLGGTINGILLHFLRHVSVLDYRFSVRHFHSVCRFDNAAQNR